MARDTSRYKMLTRRSLLLAGAQIGLFGALASRMYYLQVLESGRYAVLADANRINPRLLPPPRGLILDRRAVPLAENRQNYRLVLTPEETVDIAGTLDALGKIVPVTDYDRKRIAREIARRRPFVPVTVRENLTWDQVAQIEVNTPDLPGVNIEVGEIRHYPFGESAAHFVGYVAAVSEAEINDDPMLQLPGFRIGKNGVERFYDVSLRGTAGTSQVEVNAVGRVIRELAREEGQPGKTIDLTIDMGLQSYLYSRLQSEQSAAAVVMDVRNGDVLAMGSVPAYDPNRFNDGLSANEWQELIANPLGPLTNKSVAGQYAPGSTFKVLVTLAAVDSGIGPDHRFFCSGEYDLGDARFHCWKKGGHGQLDMYDGIKNSCDCYFYDLSRRVGIDKIAEMAKRMGLGGPTGIDLPGERQGLIPTRGWKLATMNEPWQQGETLVTGIGQGFVLATPMQLALLAARVANGGKAITPRLTRLANPPAPDLGVSAAAFQVVHEGMNRVTNDARGTAYRSRITVPGMEMAGKTGTSQVRRISMSERATGVRKNQDLPWRQRDHALFIAFAPVENPVYAISVVVEHGGGGSAVAAPIARDILIEAQRRNSARPTPALQMAQGAA